MGYARQHNTVTLSSKRFHFSPFLGCYPTKEITYGVYADRFYPLSIENENVLEDYWQLRERAMLYDVPEKPMEFRGKDASLLLERLFTREIATLKPLRARYVLACNHEGYILMDGVVIILADDHFWFVKGFSFITQL